MQQLVSGSGRRTAIPESDLTPRGLYYERTGELSDGMKNMNKKHIYAHAPLLCTLTSKYTTSRFVQDVLKWLLVSPTEVEHATSDRV